MIDDLLFILKIVAAFVPFILFALLNKKTNMKKDIRNRQYFMTPFAVVYSIGLYIFLDKLCDYCLKLFKLLAKLFDKIKLASVANFIRSAAGNYAMLVMVIVFNTLALLAYIIIKRTLTLIFKGKTIKPESAVGRLVGIFYTYDEEDDAWYIKPHLGQARTFMKAVYYGGMLVIGVIMLISFSMLRRGLINAPFYPVFAVIIIGEAMFFTDGLRKDEKKANVSFSADRSTRVAFYPLIRKPLKALFGDKLSSEGTTVNLGNMSGGSIEDILVDMENKGGHLGRNYAAFIRMKALGGMKPNADYVRCGYDLSAGKSLLFNTPFYYKLVPYVFYAMSRTLLKGGKALIVLGRHGTTDDLKKWCEAGMLEVSNTPNLWTIAELNAKENDEMDIGIITRSGVHDTDIHKANLDFLKRVSFVVIVEPSRLVSTAQIGLNLLIKCCGRDRDITYCSVDRNCDGLVDSLSHILMTNITEVSATEYPHGISTYMCWTADGDRLQHRILPGISRYLGMGTEFSFAALKNQVRNTVWYGGEAFPVVDAHWIAKQYYYDLLSYAKLPATQETFDAYFHTHFNMCDEQMNDLTYITVEDERNNVFETKRNFATIAEKQGFINVISSEYLLREYMTENTGLFTADPKAIPYFTADYARSKRNSVLTLCLNLCIDGVKEEALRRELLLMGLDTDDPVAALWDEICAVFCGKSGEKYDKSGSRVITVPGKPGEDDTVFGRSDTICFVRKYSVESGKFENLYCINDKRFANFILNDLRNAAYISEQAGRDNYIGTELKGHIYQKYLPGQFFTLNGKYYEMVSVTTDNRILMRRASEHINGRLSYRQVRDYVIERISDSDSMGALKTVNGIDIYQQYADFRVNTPAYWKMYSYNDFKSGKLTEINGVPERRYFNKLILKLDFSRFGEAFTDSVRSTLTVMLNEIFVTLFADNQPFISAVAPGRHEVPQTYSLEFGEGVEAGDKCIYIIEDSQLDIGLLITVERNINRFLNIISDYLSWNAEMTEKSLAGPAVPMEAAGETESLEEAAAKLEPAKKKCLCKRIAEWFKKKFKRKGKKDKVKKTKEEKKKEKEEKKKQKQLEKEAKKREKEAGKKAKAGLTDGEEPQAEEQSGLSPDASEAPEVPAVEEQPAESETEDTDLGSEDEPEEEAEEFGDFEDESEEEADELDGSEEPASDDDLAEEPAEDEADEPDGFDEEPAEEEAAEDDAITEEDPSGRKGEKDDE